MELLYSSLVDRIIEKVSEVKLVDLDCGQIDWPQENDPVQFPCVMISFPEIQWQSLANKLQKGDVRVQFRIAIDNYDNLSSITPASIKSRALGKLAIIKQLHSALHGFGGETFNRLQRLSSNQEQRQDGLTVFSIIYSTNIMDDAAVAAIRTTTADTLDIRAGI